LLGGETSRALFGALIYPVSVLVVACLSVSFLLAFVVPQFATLLDSFDRRRKYVYVITLPAAFDAQFARRDPQGRFIHFSPQFSLFVN
jgi:hypothetical protein